MNSRTIIDLLRDRHSQEIFVEELRAGSGYGGDSESRIDAWAMHPYPSKQNCRVSYEVKVSRSDFLRDQKKLNKHRAALSFSNEFYFVAPEGLLSPEEMPLFAGLIEVRSRDGVSRLRIVSGAPWRDTTPPSWRFVVSLARNIKHAEKYRK